MPAEDDLSTLQRWRLTVRGSLRAAGTASFLLVLYYTLPLATKSGPYVFVEFVIGVALFLGVSSWEIRAIVRADYPAIRAIQSLATTAALFLVLFASTYFVLSRGDPERFTEPLSRSDALYFTITIFATVGFGDISPVSETARLLAALQMLLDLVVLGLGIQVLLGAVRRGRDSPQNPQA